MATDKSNWCCHNRMLPISKWEACASTRTSCRAANMLYDAESRFTGPGLPSQEQAQDVRSCTSTMVGRQPAICPAA